MFFWALQIYVSTLLRLNIDSRLKSSVKLNSEKSYETTVLDFVEIFQMMMSIFRRILGSKHPLQMSKMSACYFLFDTLVYLEHSMIKDSLEFLSQGQRTTLATYL